MFRFDNLTGAAGDTEAVAPRATARGDTLTAGRSPRRWPAALVSAPLCQEPVCGKQPVPGQPVLVQRRRALRAPRPVRRQAVCLRRVLAFCGSCHAGPRLRLVAELCTAGLRAAICSSVGGTSPVGGALSGCPLVGDPGLQRPNRGAQGAQQVLSPCCVQKAPRVMAVFREAVFMPQMTFAVDCVHVKLIHVCRYEPINMQSKIQGF